MPKQKVKVCIGCLTELPLAKFNKYNEGVNGVRARCKKCFSVHRKNSAQRTAKRLSLEANGKRKCSKCGKAKALSSFQLAKRKGRKPSRDGRCKPCVSAYGRVKHKNINKDTRGYVFDYLKTHPCVDCGESNVLALEFDHLHSKKFDISNALITNKTMAILKAEIKKCVVRCSTCHRIKTHIERDTWKYNLSLQDKATSRKIKNTKQYKTLMKAG
jgi:Zn-finger protein